MSDDTGRAVPPKTAGKGRGRPATASAAKNQGAVAAEKSPAVAPPVKPPLEGYSQEEIARLVGCGQSTVSRAIRRGDVQTLTNGRLPEAAVEELRALWREEETEQAETAALERRMRTAETGEREAKAELAKLRLAQESGKYVELALVEKDAADTRERVLTVLRALPQRTAMAVDAALQAPAQRRAAVVEQLIAAEVERAIAELAEAKYGGAAK